MDGKSGRFVGMNSLICGNFLFLVVPNCWEHYPANLSSLQKLDIRECCELVVSFGSLPVISHFVINGCRKVELGGGFSSANCSSVTGPFLFRPEELRKLERLTIGSNLIIGYSSDLHWELDEGIAENEELLQKGVADSEIRILEFHRCERLERLPPLLHNFKSLRELSIKWCFRIISLPDAVIYSSLCLEVLTIGYCHSLISIGRHQLPPTLKRLNSSCCKELRRLLDVGEACSSSRVTDEDSISGDTNLSILQNLEINLCGSLTLSGESPASLKYLDLNNAKLESIAERFDNNTFLESIKIGYLPYLKSLPENLHMLTNLRHIRISHCDKLIVLPDNMHNLTSLQELTIKSCPSLVSFPQGGLPTTYLKKFIVEFCEKLDALPDNMHNLTSLQELTIKDCPGIVSFPEGGFPTNLTSLFLKVEICTLLFKWGLHRLNSLKKLSITGKCPGVLSFPQDEIDMKLPTSLTSLIIEEFQDLKHLSSKGFRSLTSLEYMKIKRCPKLASIPKNGLPPSLLSLRTYDCPLLQQSCQKGKGRESLELARIPSVEIREDEELWF
ncbi:disease resistance protein RPV1-like isoform X1 [Hevea brasiliensis]|uniref:disease resistance protein RPV1-like isoform X1 n=1 Tax=Hevea brasiliensis TaxID=3981 RepID=UPI0025DB09EC|nr:disease resistance protein RPV1-like isoform X1 [Hevea brasiliensis]